MSTTSEFTWTIRAPRIWWVCYIIIPGLAWQALMSVFSSLGIVPQLAGVWMGPAIGKITAENVLICLLFIQIFLFAWCFVRMLCTQLEFVGGQVLIREWYGFTRTMEITGLCRIDHQARFYVLGYPVFISVPRWCTRLVCPNGDAYLNPFASPRDLEMVNMLIKMVNNEPEESRQ